ncbi:MAG: hypothetical protein JNL74_06620 [Fibrobacteres bacterium]|nr:hypothetical protein [Fibrobacterota bacterium]
MLRNCVLTLLIGFIYENVSAATLLYKSNFSPAQTALAVPELSGDSKGAWQHWTGYNIANARREAVLPFNSSYSIFQIIVGRTVSSLTINNYIENSIQRIPGPHGDTVYAIHQNVKQIFPETYTQDACMLVRDQPTVEVGDVYYSYWFKFQSDLLSKMGDSAGFDNWRMMSEWKTGGSTDYRVATLIEKKIKTQSLAWVTTGQGWDTNGAGHDYWEVRNTVQPVPVGEWFKYEVFFHRGTQGKTDGQYWAAVNGKVIVDYQGSLFPPGVANPEKIDRIFLCNNYSGG